MRLEIPRGIFEKAESQEQETKLEIEGLELTAANNLSRTPIVFRTEHSESQFAILYYIVT